MLAQATLRSQGAEVERGRLARNVPLSYLIYRLLGLDCSRGC